ncbi:MAG: hypothetical protein RLZZ292_2246 [Bacteroidota bacterium]
MHISTLSTPFSNMQLELLQLYTRNVTDDDLAAIKDLLAQFFAKKATALADKAWDEKGLDADTILNAHFRTSYKK